MRMEEPECRSQNPQNVIYLFLLWKSTVSSATRLVRYFPSQRVASGGETTAYRVSQMKSCNKTEPLNQTKCHKAQKLTLTSSILRAKVHLATSDTRVRRPKSEENRLTGNPKLEISWFAISAFDNREGQQARVIRSRMVKKKSEQANKQASKRLSEKRQERLRHERVERKGRLCYEIFIGIYACFPLGNKFFTHVFFIVLYLLHCRC